MPLITVKLIEDVFTPEQKVKIIETITDAMVAIEGENLRELTFVLIEEVKQGDWGVGRNPRPASDVPGLQGPVAARPESAPGNNSLAPDRLPMNIEQVQETD